MRRPFNHKYIRFGVLIGFATAIVNAAVSTKAQDSGTKSQTNTNAPTPAEQALALLKPAVDRLSAAKAFTFKAHNMVEVASPVGQTIHYFFTSDVEVARPNKLKSRKSGDGPAFDLYYDGKKFSGVDEKLGLFAQMDAPATLDELVPFVLDKSEIYFPFADVLNSDVYGSLTKDLKQAYWVQKSTVDGVSCNHLAFAGPDVEWQIWVGPENDPLPRRLIVTYISVEKQPRFLVAFSDWRIKPSLPAKDFEFKKPKDAKEIQFRPLPRTSNN